MKLWHLFENLGVAGSPWYDQKGRRKRFVNRGFVVRADSEAHVRVMAAHCAQDEGAEAWLNPNFSSCDEITQHGSADMLLRDADPGRR